MLTAGWGVPRQGEAFTSIAVERRDLRAHDVLVSVAYAGICHTDVHRARGEWGTTTYPIVPGHEITGVVMAVGDAAVRHRVGDRVGIGCMVDSCRTCEPCRAGHEQYCHDRHVLTYNDVEHDGSRTYGGYSRSIVVDEAYVVPVPDGLDLAAAAPLLCAGITTYSPLVRWNAGPATRVGVIGMGGLGHLGVRFAAALGAEVVVFDLDASKTADAKAFGATDLVVASDPGALDPFEHALDLVLNTVPAPLDLDRYLRLLDLDGTFVNLGVPHEPLSVVAHSLLHGRRSLSGSLIGGIAETAQMLRFCAEHEIGSQVEVVAASDVDLAYERLTQGDVRYRFVLDVGTIPDLS